MMFDIHVEFPQFKPKEIQVYMCYFQIPGDDDDDDDVTPTALHTQSYQEQQKMIMMFIRLMNLIDLSCSKFFCEPWSLNIPKNHGISKLMIWEIQKKPPFWRVKHHGGSQLLLRDDQVSNRFNQSSDW